MTRTEKVREALQAVRRDYELMNQIIAAHPAVAHPFTIGPKVADEALSLLDGCVIVPREATEEMFIAGIFMCNIPPNKVWSAMIAASEDGE